MIDISIDDSLNLTLTAGNDLTTVEGRKLAEQQFRVGLYAFFDSIIGTVSKETVIQRVELQVDRLLTALDLIESVETVNISWKSEIPPILQVTLRYDTGDAFSVDLE